MKLNFPLPQMVQRSLYPLISITIPLLIYATVLIVDVPTEISIAIRYGFTTVLIAISLLLYPAYRQSGWVGTLASLSLTLILFALPLSALWNSGISDGYIIGGLAPWSDARGYYWDAQRLLEGGTFSEIPPQRPLFAGMLATLLALTQQNLQVTVAILVAIAGISCFLAAREVQRSHGTAAGLVVIATLFLFYRRFLGKTSTETLGLSLGAVGFALLWRGARLKQLNNCLVGIFLLTLALNARAGAFFILPALILWGTWSFRGADRFSMRFLIGGSSVVLLGFILNSILLKFVGSPNGIGFSNFSYTLYGILTESNWTQVRVDHPELNNIVEPELSRRIYALAFEKLRDNPFALVTGSFRAWNLFILGDYAFTFVNNLKANFVLQILSIIALLTCYSRRLDPNASLVIASVLGILVSVPFAPPWDADGMRAYAATIPALSVLPALGLAFLAKNMGWHPLVQVSNQENQPRSLLIFSLAIVVLSFLGPITVKAFSRTPQVADIKCQPGMSAVYVHIRTGSLINLVADDAIPKTRVPNIRLSDFKKRMDGNGIDNFDLLYPEITKELTSLSPSTTMMNTFNLKDWRFVWLIADSTKIPKQSSVVGVCGKMTTNPASVGYGFFYADSIERVSR